MDRLVNTVNWTCGNCGNALSKEPTEGLANLDDPEHGEVYEGTEWIYVCPSCGCRNGIFGDVNPLNPDDYVR